MYSFNWSYNITSGTSLVITGITAGITSSSFGILDNSNYVNNYQSQTVAAGTSTRISGNCVNYLTLSGTVNPTLTLSFSSGTVTSVTSTLSTFRLV